MLPREPPPSRRGTGTRGAEKTVEPAPPLLAWFSPTAPYPHPPGVSIRIRSPARTIVAFLPPKLTGSRPARMSRFNPHLPGEPPSALMIYFFKKKRQGKRLIPYSMLRISKVAMIRQTYPYGGKTRLSESMDTCKVSKNSICNFVLRSLPKG